MKLHRIPPLNGEHSTSRPNLRYRFDVPINFEKRVANFFHGSNGAGKTTLLERLMVPHVERCKGNVLFWGSDSRNVEMAIRMSASVQQAIGNKRRAQSTLYATDAEDSFRSLVGPALQLTQTRDGPLVIILDECQPNVSDFLAHEISENMSSCTWCIVRHQPDRDVRAFRKSGIKMNHYGLTRMNALVMVNKVQSADDRDN